MLENLNLLDDHEVVVVRGHPQHHSVLHIQRNLAGIPVLPAYPSPPRSTPLPGWFFVLFFAVLVLLFCFFVVLFFVCVPSRDSAGAM